jgi:hypothetical protein
MSTSAVSGINGNRLDDKALTADSIITRIAAASRDNSIHQVDQSRVIDMLSLLNVELVD